MIFINTGKGLGKPIVIPPTVGVWVVSMSTALTPAKGPIVKLVSGCVDVLSEVRNVDFNTSFGEEDIM